MHMQKKTLKFILRECVFNKFFKQTKTTLGRYICSIVFSVSKLIAVNSRSRLRISWRETNKKLSCGIS